jgi:hypothetical protein
MRTTADINKLTVLFDREQASVMNLIDLVLLQAIKEDGGNFQALDRQQLRHVSRVRKTT